MKEGWEYKKLGEVATVSHGKNQKEVEDIHGEYPIYGSGGNIMGYANSYLCESGTTILGRKGTINNPLYIETKFWNVDTAFGITAKDGNSKKYIYYFVKSQDWSKKDTGTTLPSLTQKVVKETIIPVPPLSEQQRIVSYLDAAFAKIDAVAKNAEDSLNDAKALFQSALAKMMEPKEGWEEKTLSEIGMTLTGTTPSKSNSAFYGNYMPFIRPSEINYDGLGNLDYNSQIKLSKEGSEAGRVIKPGSILMVCIGATISKVGYSKQDVSCNQQINVIEPYDEYNYKFIYYAMTAPSFKAKVIKEGSSSQATLPIINKKKWEQLTIAYPSLDEQNLIADKLDRLNQKIHVLSSNLTRTLSECAALKQSILRETFE